MEENYDISDEAKLELHKAKCFFEFLEKEEEFLDDFLHQLRVISQMPYGFQIRYRNVRIVKFEHFNYSIHYAIFNEQIIILRILNQLQSY